MPTGRRRRTKPFSKAGFRLNQASMPLPGGSAPSSSPRPGTCWSGSWSGTTTWSAATGLRSSRPGSGSATTASPPRASSGTRAWRIRSPACRRRSSTTATSPTTPRSALTIAQHGRSPLFVTDTEVAVVLFDLLRRVRGYPRELVATLAATRSRPRSTAGFAPSRPRLLLSGDLCTVRPGAPPLQHLHHQDRRSPHTSACPGAAPHSAAVLSSSWV